MGLLQLNHHNLYNLVSEKVEIILEILVNFLNKGGKTPLHYAVTRGKSINYFSNVIEEYVQNDPIILN